MTTNNYVYPHGTLFVARGGGSAPEPLTPGAANQALFADPSADLGVAWGAGSAMGNVVGPVSSVAHHLAAFADTSGVLLEDSGILTANVVQGPASTVDNTVPRFDTTTGKLLQSSPVTMADTTGTMTFPAGGGIVLTTGGGAARKGTFTLTAGASGDIATSSVLTGSVIQVCITALGTVTAPQATYVTITNETKFVITSADATDTSSGTWSIVA
jgi:hypothetical protein